MMSKWFPSSAGAPVQTITYQIILDGCHYVDIDNLASCCRNWLVQDIQRRLYSPAKNG